MARSLETGSKISNFQPRSERSPRPRFTSAKVSKQWNSMKDWKCLEQTNILIMAEGGTESSRGAQWNILSYQQHWRGSSIARLKIVEVFIISDCQTRSSISGSSASREAGSQMYRFRSKVFWRIKAFLTTALRETVSSSATAGSSRNASESVFASYHLA